MHIPSSIKSLAYRLLPEKTLISLKLWHYNRQFRDFDVESIPEYAILKILMPRAAVAIDVGANIGLYTKALSTIVGPQGKVYSFEPVPTTFEILRSNVAHLASKNALVFNYALSDNEGIVTMEIPSYVTAPGISHDGEVFKGGGDNYYCAKIITSEENISAKHVSVNSKTIDSLFRDKSENIAFIKYDVEGHELPCLKGSLEIIRRYKPALLIEVMDDPQDQSTSAHSLFELLSREGYIPYFLKGDKLKLFEGERDSINFFFLQSNHVHLLQPVLIGKF